MQRNQTQKKGAIGRLPNNAPLANPYVPFQIEGTPLYSAGKGMIRGTIYPGLDLPFMGMVNKKELPVSLKTELQILAFAIQELALYLDTHKNDQEAFAMYHSYQQMYQNCIKAYTEKKPMNHRTPTTGNQYRWLDDPWPWEYAANREA